VIRRRAGLLAHPTSLPAVPGGFDGAVASFLAWAESAGASVWQILPLHPPGPGQSPYGARSTFAGDPSWFGDDPGADRSAIEAFATAHASWLDDWALYASIRESREGQPWPSWDEPLRRRVPEALARERIRLGDAIERHTRLQYVFFDRWAGLRELARDHGVAILGDVPIYVALDSADVWAHQDSFWLDDRGAPMKRAGVPPDYFSKTGQLWGNPIYRWDRMASSGFTWWVKRLEHSLTLHDAVRLDHFRGFAGYWSVPPGADSAIEGAWEPGPGMPLFDAVRASLGRLPFLAEDLGIITDDVTTLRKTLGLPGMRVLQFGFEDPRSPHAARNLTPDVVVYTGTHDNDTARGWFAGLDPAVRRRVSETLGGGVDEVAWGLIRMAMISAAQAAIVPLQDVLDLGSDARMNTPGVAEGNWTWQAPPGSLTESLARRFRTEAAAGARCEMPPE
jgi:4-alpha-glucanotransferase